MSSAVNGSESGVFEVGSGAIGAVPRRTGRDNVARNLVAENYATNYINVDGIVSRLMREADATGRAVALINAEVPGAKDVAKGIATDDLASLVAEFDEQARTATKVGDYEAALSNRKAVTIGYTAAEGALAMTVVQKLVKAGYKAGRKTQGLNKRVSNPDESEATGWVITCTRRATSAEVSADKRTARDDSMAKAKAAIAAKQAKQTPRK